jgi:hypothetical protein
MGISPFQRDDTPIWQKRVTDPVIKTFGCCTEHAMEPDGVCLHVDFSCELANVKGQ